MVHEIIEFEAGRPELVAELLELAAAPGRLAQGPEHGQLAVELRVDLFKAPIDFFASHSLEGGQRRLDRFDHRPGEALQIRIRHRQGRHDHHRVAERTDQNPALPRLERHAMAHPQVG